VLPLSFVVCHGPQSIAPLFQFPVCRFRAQRNDRKYDSCGHWWAGSSVCFATVSSGCLYGPFAIPRFGLRFQSLKQAATEESEINVLLKVVKKFNAINDILEVVQKSGTESEEYKATFDTVVTGLRLDPAIEVGMPPHLLYARHCLDIRATEDMKRFFTYISSPELSKQGVTNLAADQVLRLSSGGCQLSFGVG